MNNQQGQALASVASAVSLGFNGLPYSPALLLDGCFDASITDGLQFREACQDGYGCFLEENGGVSVNRSYAWHDIQEVIVGEVACRYDVSEQAYEQRYGSFLSLSYRAGFTLGWLSALAFMDRPLALQGVGLLAVLVRVCRTEEGKRVAA